jgi:hypothetical protein
MTEEEEDEIFGDDFIFQEIFQMLKLADWTESSHQEYLNEKPLKFPLEMVKKLTAEKDRQES